MYKLLELYTVLFLWKNFWPFLMSGGIQNPLVSVWPSLLGHQPPAWPSSWTSLTVFGEVRQMLLDLLCQ